MLCDVGARAERATGAGDGDQPHLVVVLGLVVGGPEFGDHVRAERVEGFRAVQRDGGGVPVDLVFDGVERVSSIGNPFVRVIGPQTSARAAAEKLPGLL